MLAAHLAQAVPIAHEARKVLLGYYLNFVMNGEKAVADRDIDDDRLPIPSASMAGIQFETLGYVITAVPRPVLVDTGVDALEFNFTTLIDGKPFTLMLLYLLGNRDFSTDPRKSSQYGHVTNYAGTMSTLAIDLSIALLNSPLYALSPKPAG